MASIAPMDVPAHLASVKPDLDPYGQLLRMLMPRAVEILPVEEAREPAKHLLMARCGIEHGQVAHDLLARRKAEARDEAENFQVAVREAEGARGLGSRQPLERQRQRIHVLIIVPRH